MKWLIFTSQLPASPSSLRVMVWRRMKAAGAVSLQNGVWVLPHTREQERVVDELLSYLHAQGAGGQSFIAAALNDKVEQDLVRRFQELRDEEYVELIERCQDLLAELEKETLKDKFTFAELEENEDELQKLENWLSRIKSRDLLGGEHAKEAAQYVETCKKALDVFAKSVYDREQIDPKEDVSK